MWIERDTLQDPEARARHPVSAPGQQVGVEDRKLETGWRQEVGAGQERAGGALVIREKEKEGSGQSQNLRLAGTAGGRARVCETRQRAGTSKSRAEGKQRRERPATGHGWRNDPSLKIPRGWVLVSPVPSAWHAVAALCNCWLDE